MYIPRINLPLEAVEHARWLEKRAVDSKKETDELRRLVETLLKQNATSARRSAAQSQSASSGLPPGGTIGMLPYKSGSSDQAVGWVYGWQGLMAEYWVTLQDGSSSYSVTAVGDSAEVTKALLPPITFSGTGERTMDSIDFVNYGTEYGGVPPFHLNVEVVPQSDGETFTVNLPTYPHSTGPSAPYYTLRFVNDTAFEAHVLVPNAKLFYAATRIPVLGDTAWDLPAGFNAAWHVLWVNGEGSAAVPVRAFLGTNTSSDEYYDAAVLDMQHMFPWFAGGAVVVGAGPHRITNDTLHTMRVGKITTSVGTAPTGASLIVEVLKNGVTLLGTAEILAGESYAVADLESSRSLAAGDYVTFDVTQVGSTVAGSDLTVQVWAG